MVKDPAALPLFTLPRLTQIMDDFFVEETEFGEHGYNFEPERSSESNSSENDSELSDSSDSVELENAAAQSIQGRTSMAVSTWCKRGNCAKQKSDIENYCCKEHELGLEIVDEAEVEYITLKPQLEEYVAHKPALEMLFIDCMIRRFVKGPAPRELSNRYITQSPTAFIASFSFFVSVH